MAEPLISIVLTTFNRCALLKRAVESVLGGTYKKFEIIVLDDASTDGTADYVRGLTDSRIRYVQFPANGGVLRSRNRGFNEARGDYVTILDDDDELVPDALATIASSFAAPENANIDILWFDCLDVESDQRSGFVPVPNARLDFDEYLTGRVHGDFWMAFRRRALTGHRFDERLKAHESLLWLRMHRDHAARHVAKVLCRKYRRHGGPRLCDINVRMGQLNETTLAMTSFVQEFGDNLLRSHPAVFGRKLAYLGLHEMAIGDFSRGRSSVSRSLRYRFSVKYVALYLASFFLSRGAIVALIRRIESEAEAVT
jgi:glycosyltransferase involved in cell wall biosynthesis